MPFSRTIVDVNVGRISYDVGVMCAHPKRPAKLPRHTVFISGIRRPGQTKLVHELHLPGFHAQQKSVGQHICAASGTWLRQEELVRVKQRKRNATH